MKTATTNKANAAALAKANNLQLLNSPALQFVPLELIETREQIRTNFIQESIEELAEDIKARGMLQPVLLRPLADGKFLMITGERRLRAARFAALDNIPALIGEVDDQTASLMQLAENIHREELDLQEECQAIKKLYEILGSLDKVADMVKKSKPWCSKRFVMTQTQLHYLAGQLLETGVTEDIELLNAYSNLCKIVSWSDSNAWGDKIRKGTAGRNEIRTALKEAKAEAKKEKEKAAAAKEKVSHAKPRTPPPPPAWNIEDAMEQLSEALGYADADLSGAELLASWTEAQQNEVKQKLIEASSLGGAETGFKTIAGLIMAGVYSSPYTDIELAAMVWGHGGKLFDLDAFLQELQTPREKS